MSKLLNELLKKVGDSTGGAETRTARGVTVRRFCAALAQADHHAINVDQLKPKAIQRFIESMRADGLKERTIHNRISHLRTLLPRVLKGFDNSRLGLQPTSRDGTKRAITDQEFAERIAKVRDLGCRLALELQRTLGLRAQESIRSADSLADWKRQLDSGKAIVVYLGSKGGRARHVWPADRERLARVLDQALAVAKAQGGRLVVAAPRVDKSTGKPTPELRSALMKLENAARRAGFKGEISQHSTRYAFAGEQVAGYKVEGYDKRQATALASLDLGHGDGRGTYVDRVYSRR